MGQFGQQIGKPGPTLPGLIVVSNTSPLTNLAAIGHFDLLRALLGQLHVSEGVVGELSFAGKQWPGRYEVEQANWINVHKVADRQLVESLRLGLDLGEAETIALALQLRADLVLMDEQAGRRAARHLGLNVVGVVGLLVRARQTQLIPAITPLLESLQQQAGFYISQSLINYALVQANEQ